MLKKAMLLVFACLISFSAFAETHDLVKIGGDVEVKKATTVNDAVVIGGDLEISGDVLGDAVVFFGDVTVRNGAKVAGSTIAIFGKIFKEPDAVVSKDVFELSINKIISNMSNTSCSIPVMGMGAFWMFLVTVSIGFLALFLLIAILFTGNIGAVSYYAESRMLKSFYYGILVSILVIPLTLFLLISIVGIPIIPLLMIVISAATLFGYAAMCQLIGLKFFKAFKKKGVPMFWEVVVGFAILFFVVMIPVLGWLIKTVVWMIGLGATIATKFGTRKV